jgi:Tol biopolymer transport system component
MGSRRWREIEALYHAALECEAGDRAALMARADPDVRGEVESLLAQASAGMGLSSPAWEQARGLLSGSAHQVAAGTQFGPYRIESTLGAGGMGRVYRALDTRLNRSVALKIAHEGFGSRFGREARAIGQLNHPHICTLHDVGPDYLVMELVEGETLSARLAGGALPLEEVLRYGVQIADALATAHGKRIVHRDLKPGNIMLTKTGVKVLDFGLAKTQTDETVTRSQEVLGTPAYMAPEQRQGGEADARTDIYALGLVLKEMATGKRAGDLAGFSPHFVHVVNRCLESDPADRWQAASDVMKELEWAAASAPTATVAARPDGRWLVWGVAAGAIATLLAAGTWFATRKVEVVRLDPVRFPLDFAREIQNSDLSTLPVPSPSGDALVFSGKGVNGGTSLWVRALESVEARRLAGTDGASRVAWSPGGDWIAFYADGTLKKVSPRGGPVQTIATIPGFQEAAWGSDGDIIFRPDNRAALLRIRDTGGSPQPLTTLNTALAENSHRFPEFLPGRLFFFVTRSAERANNALYVGSLDSPEVTRVMPAESRVSYVPAGPGRPEMLIYYKDGSLVAQRFDLAGRRLIGETTPLFDRIFYNAPSIEARFRVSANGRVVVAEPAESNDRQFVWFDRSGTEVGRLGEVADNSQPRISPQGDRVVFSRPDPRTGNRDVFYTEIARDITARLTTHVANDWNAVWSPDGKHLVFGSDRDGAPALRPYLKTSMDPGSGESRLAENPGTPSDWSSDGAWLLYQRLDDLYVGRASEAVEPFAFLATPAIETLPRFSPDGKWISYGSDESGRPEIYIRPFSGAPAGPTGKIRVSHNGGEGAMWGSSQEILYLSADRTIYSVDTRNLGKSETLPAPVKLFAACPLDGTLDLWPIDTRDGLRFLIACRREPLGRFIVLMNWTLP